MPEELFFLFIASCISLWLIQLATESIERRRDSRRIQRGTARERSRGHLILVKRIKNLTRMIGVQPLTSNSTRQPDLSRRSATWTDFLLSNKDKRREAGTQRS
jgi:hypothetical protein